MNNLILKHIFLTCLLEIVLFATTNRKYQKFCSREGLGHQSLGDAFLISWLNSLLYTHPPATQSPKQNEAGQSQSHPNCTNLAKTKLVPLPDSPHILSSSTATDYSQPAHSGFMTRSSA